MPDLTGLIETWGYVAVSLVVVFGNIGLPVPEETVLVVAGYLVRVGRWGGRRYSRSESPAP
jgi:membrane protein DedA with SNARE-associated domain